MSAQFSPGTTVDIVERLRRTAKFVAQQTGAENSRWITEAADEIERLRPYVEAFRREETRADKLGTEVDELRERILSLAQTVPGCGDPVAWQRRLKNGDRPWSEWRECTEAQARFADKHSYPENFPTLAAEVRPLYATSVSSTEHPEQQRIADELNAKQARMTSKHPRQEGS